MKKKRGGEIEELIQASKVPLERMFKIMKSLVQSGASRYTTKKTMDSVAKKKKLAVKSPEKYSFSVSNRQSYERITAYV